MQDSLIGKRPKAWYQAKAAEGLDENDWDLDDDPVVSESEDGAYVMVWRWIPNDLED